MILVTGATGRVGKHLVAALLEKGWRVRVLVRDPAKAKALWGDAVEVSQGDILDRASVASAAHRVDTVFHLAALLSRGAPKDQLFRANYEGSRNVFDAAKGGRIIHLSSTSVYGNKVTSPVTEGSVFAPSDSYGQSKAAADRLAREIGAVVLRPTVVYGPGFSEGFFQLFRLMEKGRMVVAGSGKNRLQWSHIDDLVGALLLASENGRPGEAYNIVGDDVRTQEEFLSICARLLNMAPPKRHIPLSLLKVFGRMLANKAFIDTFTADRVFDCSKAKRDLSWNPAMTFENGLKDAVEEYRLSKA